MKRFLTSALLTAGASLAVHLYRKQQSPKAFVQETVDHVQARKEALTKVNQQAADVKTRLADFQDELKKKRSRPLTASKPQLANFNLKFSPTWTRSMTVCQN